MKVFIAGPRAISKLDKAVEERLQNIYAKQITIIVGDANGVDRAVQQYFYNLKYANVSVYASRGKARNNIGNWDIVKVDVKNNTKGFDFYSAKDIKMADDADYGFMIWNGISKGTLNNIINLIRRNKKTLVFLTPTNHFDVINHMTDLKKLLEMCDGQTQMLYQELNKKSDILYVTEDETVYGAGEQISF